MRLYRTANRTYAGATSEALEHHLVAEFLAVHDMFKRELAKMAQFVEELLGVQESTPADEVAKRIQALAQSMYQYTSVLHSHHHGETDYIFPGLETEGLDSEIVARLNSEHDDLAVLMDKVDATLSARESLVNSELDRDLHRLAGLLHAHLDFEETHVCPLLARFANWQAVQRAGMAQSAFGSVADEEEQMNAATARTAPVITEPVITETISRGTGFVAGISILPDAMDPAQAFRLATLADEAGYDLLAVQDHPYNPQFLDTWTLLTALAMYTQRIALATDVANLGLRPPAMLLKAASTLQLLTGGRVILGVGGGASDRSVAGFGGLQVTSVRELGDAFEEALKLFHELADSSGAPTSFAGSHHRLYNAQFGPSLRIHTPIWTGALKPRGLRLTGTYADGWFIPLNSYVSAQELPALQRTVDEAATAAQRDPRAIRRVWNLAGVITPNGEAGRTMRGSMRGSIRGPVKYWIDEVGSYINELGIDGMVFWPAQDVEQQADLFAEQVLPALRAEFARKMATS